MMKPEEQLIWGPYMRMLQLQGTMIAQISPLAK